MFLHDDGQLRHSAHYGVPASRIQVIVRQYYPSQSICTSFNHSLRLSQAVLKHIFIAPQFLFDIK